MPSPSWSAQASPRLPPRQARDPRSQDHPRGHGRLLRAQPLGQGGSLKTKTIYNVVDAFAAGTCGSDAKGDQMRPLQNCDGSLREPPRCDSPEFGVLRRNSRLTALSPLGGGEPLFGRGGAGMACASNCPSGWLRRVREPREPSTMLWMACRAFGQPTHRADEAQGGRRAARTYEGRRFSPGRAGARRHPRARASDRTVAARTVAHGACACLCCRARWELRPLSGWLAARSASPRGSPVIRRPRTAAV